MKKKIIIFSILIIVIIAIVIFVCFFQQKDYKTSNLGNNINKSIYDFEQYILNISSYEANITVEIESNKNNNKYQIKQQYSEPNIYQQEILEPGNIKGLITTYDGNQLTIKNTQLDCSKIYENYQYISDNFLCLHHFIENYKVGDEKKIEEINGQVVMKAKVKDSKNQYNVYQTLYLDKKSGNPVKLEIQDVNQNTIVYILYNEIKINSTSKEEVLAFQLHFNTLDI